MLKKTATKLLFLTSFLLGCSIITCSLATKHWLLDLTTHFRVHFVIVALLATVVSMLVQERKLFVVCLLCSFFHLLPIQNEFHIKMPTKTARAATGKGAAQTSSFVVANLLTSNSSKHLFTKYLLQTKPDFFGVLELGSQWHAFLKKQLGKEYPYAITSIREDNFGIGLYSKHPLSGKQITRNGLFAVPTIDTNIQLRGKKIRFVLAHTVPPVGKSLSKSRNIELENLAGILETTKGPAFLAGDLNITPWSPHFKRFLKKSQTKDSRIGFGVQPTWPSRLGKLGIPIDHVVSKGGIRVLHRSISPHIGSDHRAVFVRFSF